MRQLILPVALTLASMLSPHVAAFEAVLSLKQIRQIARSGTPGLALKLLDQQHPGIAKGFDQWFQWTQARTEILVASKAWVRADQHLTHLPENLPEPLQRWALSQRAWLLLERGDAATARKILRDLLWRHGARTQDPTEAALWRRLLIRSYLLQDRIDDAAAAMHRYQQDFASTQPEWLQLRARILLRQGRPGVILELSPESLQKLPQTLRLLAYLRSGQSDPLHTYRDALNLAMDLNSSATDRARYLAIAAEASSLANQPAKSISALERALEFSAALPSSDKLFAVSADELWAAYRTYGDATGNREQLLAGDDIAWTKAILEAIEQQAFLRGKGLLAAMSYIATSEARRQQALTQLAQLLNEERGDWMLAYQLFRRSERFPGLLHIPPTVRAHLVEYALSVSDMVEASELLVSLPDDARQKGFAERLRHARVMVFGDRIDDGLTVLNRILDEELFFTPDQLDQFMQVVFDLQAAEHHQHALKIFGRLEVERQLPAERRRELFFWMAESFEATDQYPQAALYFMRSATYTNPGGADLWGQSARYRSAEALTAAGLVSDARRLYESLLASTDDKARQAVLRGKLQQLWVTPSDSDDIKN